MIEQTRNEFWQTYFYFQDSSRLPATLGSSVEQLRFRALLGMTALDATLSTYWKHAVLPEWDSVMSLVESTLEDEESLALLANALPEVFSRGQWIATLRYIANTGEPQRFSPSFSDVAAILWMTARPDQQKDSGFCSYVEDLFRLQKLRNSCFHTAKDYNELRAIEAIQVIDRVYVTGTKVHVCLAPNGFQSQARRILKAA